MRYDYDEAPILRRDAVLGSVAKRVDKFTSLFQGMSFAHFAAAEKLTGARGVPVAEDKEDH